MRDEATFAVAPQIVYAVWIRGSGWLKEKDEDARTTFVAFSPDVAGTAARLWGESAVVLAFDQSLLDLEQKFLAREKEVAARRGLRGFVNGVLG